MKIPRKINSSKTGAIVNAAIKWIKVKSLKRVIREENSDSLKDDKIILPIKEPKKIGLPAIHMTSSYIFAKNDLFLAYVNNYNHYVSYYKNTYQHGGISLEEMIIPFATYTSK